MQKFDLQGNFLYTWGEYQPISITRSFFSFLFNPGAEGNFNYTTRIAVSPDDTLYVSDAYNNRVVAFSTGGEFLFQFGGVGVFPDNFRVSSGVATDKIGNLYVADFYNLRIQMFSGKGSFLRKWGQKSTGIMQFDGPTDITVDQQGRAYVADWGNHRLQVFQIPEIK